MRLPDHTIIATAKAIQMADSKRKQVLVSRDINMSVICDSIGLDAEDYTFQKKL